jgi:TRAP-type transport system periplasmic protein
MKRNKIFAALLIFSMLFFASSVAFAGKKVMKMAIIDPLEPKGNPTAALSMVFKTEVESRTNGDIEVRIYPSGSLGTQREILEQINAGVTHSSAATLGGVSAFYPNVDILNAPFVFKNIEDAYRLMQSDFMSDFQEDIRKKTGFHVLGFIPVAGFQLTNSKGPIKTPADMKGLKMRTMTMPLHMKFMEALGASATPIAWSEIYTSLQTRVVDGQHNPLYIIQTSKLYEVQKYMTISNHMTAFYCWVVSDKWFSSLSSQEQDIVKRSAEVALIAAKGIDRIIESTEALQYLNEKMEVYTLTAAQKQQFMDEVKPSMEKYYKENLDADGLRWYQGLIGTLAK